jgi:hypothetical protein
MKTAKTPYLATQAFTEGEITYGIIFHTLCAHFSPPDLDSVCAPAIEHVKRGGSRKGSLPKGIGDLMLKGVVARGHRKVPKGITAERHW